MSSFRFSIILVLLAVAYSALVFNIYNIQLVNGDRYLAKAESQYHYSSKILQSKRGIIYLTDKNNNQVAAATNKNFPIIYAVPKVIEDIQETAHRLSPILQIPPKKLIDKLSKPNDSYELLMRKANVETVRKIENLNIKGIYIENIPERFYPFNRLLSHVLGFVGPDKKGNSESGHYGIEEFYNSKLSGSPGRIENGKIVRPKPGKNIVLTIDPNVQIEAENILKNLIDKYKAKSGTVIVEEPNTGKILAMANYPNFNPNDYKDFDIKTFINSAVQKIYEPGSVFKVITMSAGIDSQKITPETKFFDKGYSIISGRKIQNWDYKSHGLVTMTNVIEKSINTGAVFAQQKMGNRVFKEYLGKFGFGEKTGIDTLGEVKGDIHQLKDDAPAIDFATASFGQGVAVTPIELINAISAIANGGNLMRPYLSNELKPSVIRRVISRDTSNKVKNMMLSAVDKAKVAKINGYTIAGKTGTAQVPDFHNGGYKKGVYINTFVGFGPVSNPKFTALIKIDEPEGAPLAGTTVVPAFRNLAQFILNYYNVKPDRVNN